MKKLWFVLTGVLVLILVSPLFNSFAHSIYTTYCLEYNDWVREIFIRFIKIELSDYPSGGICE